MTPRDIASIVSIVGARESGAALIDALSGRVTTWAELHERGAALAGRLAAAGAAPGSRVAVIEPPGVDVAATMHACLRLGASLAPLSPRLPEPELRRHLEDLRPSVVLTSRNADSAVRLLRDPPDGWPALEAWSFDRSLRAIDLLPPVDAESPIGGDPEVAVVYTSGSTGSPKGVRLTLGNCVASAEGCGEALGGITADDRWLLALPTHRVGGLAILWRSLLSGASVVYLDRFSESGVQAALPRRPTLASLVPAMLHRLASAGRMRDLEQLRAILLGGAASPASQVALWAVSGLKVCPSYGLTETGSQVAVVPPGRAGDMPGSSGLVHSRAVVEVDAEPGRAGEILVGGPVLTPGYTDVAAGTDAFISDGARRRLRTKDIGRLSDGVLYVVGRGDRMIVTGGEKVSPEEVEGVLLAHEAVHDALVTGDSDATYGTVVVATVSGDIDEEALRRWCAERLAPHKVPRRFRFVDAVSRSEEGKLVWHETAER